MVYWLICKDIGGDERRFGPYESEPAARAALDVLRTCLLASTTGRYAVVCDYA